LLNNSWSRKGTRTSTPTAILERSTFVRISTGKKVWKSIHCAHRPKFIGVSPKLAGYVFFISFPPASPFASLIVVAPNYEPR
jgi:hypothetical protein